LNTDISPHSGKRPGSEQGQSIQNSGCTWHPQLVHSQDIASRDRTASVASAEKTKMFILRKNGVAGGGGMHSARKTRECQQ